MDAETTSSSWQDDMQDTETADGTLYNIKLQSESLKVLHFLINFTLKRSAALNFITQQILFLHDVQNTTFKYKRLLEF